MGPSGPTALAGFLAVLLAYRLGRRPLGPETAAVAAVLLAVLPITIAFSRLGFDCSWTPLLSLLFLMATLRAHGPGMVASFLACVSVHPTNVFLLPVVAPRILIRAVRSERRRRWEIGAALVALAAIALLVGLTALSSPGARNLDKGPPEGRYDLLRAATLFDRMLLAAPPKPDPWQDVLFAAVAVPLLVAGTARLIAGRRTDELALIAGVILGAISLIVAAGVNVLCVSKPVDAGHFRYGLFLVAPTTLAAAGLVRALLIAPTTPRRATLRELQHVGLLALGAALLLSYKANRLDPFEIPESDTSTRETLWTFGSDRPALDVRIFKLIRRDRGRRPHPGLIVAQNFWLHQPLEYLALRHPEIHVADGSRPRSRPAE